MATLADAVRQARQLLGAGRLAEAEPIYRQLLQAAPGVAELWHEMGLLQLQAKRPDQALEYLTRAVTLEPRVPAYHGNLAVAYRQLRRQAEAIDSCQRAIDLGAPTAELYNNLGLALKDAKRVDDALAAFDAALRLRPDYANGFFNRGNLLLDVGRMSAAVESYLASIRFRPDDAGAYCKLGVAYYDQGEMSLALDSFERALQLQPDYPEVRRNRALVWLAQGDYERGWPEYQWRLECEGYGKRPFHHPAWDGSPLQGRTILVHAEQGLGDTLQFIRYLPLVERAGGRPLVDVQPALVPLLVQSGFGHWLVPPETQPAFDVQIPLMSLAGLLPDRAGPPFWDGPYLVAAANLVEAWHERLRTISGFKVGIVWAGNPDHPHDRFRSVRLAQFARLAEIPGVQLVSLQKGAGQTQLADAALPWPVVDLGDDLDRAEGAFMDTAAAIAHLDLVIAVDTAVAHLAGGLGARVWVPLQLSPDWRWGITGAETAWYPSMKLFRQQKFDDWDPVFDQMAAELRRLAKNR